MRASAFGSVELDDKYAKRAFLFCNHVINAHPYDESNHAPTMIRIGEAGQLAYVGSNVAYLEDKKKLYKLRAGYDSTMLELIHHCRGLIEREFNEDCLISPIFLKPEADLQPALSFRFLDHLAPSTNAASLEDVICFNHENQPSLASFWNAVYEVAENADGLISMSADRRLNAVLQESLQQLEAAQRRAWGQNLLNRFEITVALPAGVAAELVARQFFGENFPEGLLLFGSTTLEISLHRQRIGSLSERAKAMTFLYDAKMELPRSR